MTKDPFGRPFIPPQGDQLSNAVVRDAYGRVLREGDYVLLDQPLVRQPVKVTAIAPVVDPSAPPNLMQITFSMTYQFRCVRNERAVEFLRVATKEEAEGEKRKIAQSELQAMGSGPISENN